jgi:photosystem II stability/assembly factor-like uncharacterized protein
MMKKPASFAALGCFCLRRWLVLLFAGFLLFMPSNAAKAQNWTWQNPLPQGHTLTEVFFSNANTGYTVGLDGTILKTTDAGINWTALNTGTTFSFSSVYFINADTGYALAPSTILKTTDGGLSWISQPIAMPYLTSVFLPVPIPVTWLVAAAAMAL